MRGYEMGQRWVIELHWILVVCELQKERPRYWMKYRHLTSQSTKLAYFGLCYSFIILKTARLTKPMLTLSTIQQQQVFRSIRMAYYLFGKKNPASIHYPSLMYYSFQIISLELCVPIVASITCYKHFFLDYPTFMSQPFEISNPTKVVYFEGLIHKGRITMNQEDFQECFNTPIRIDLQSHDSNGNKHFIGSVFFPLFFELLDQNINQPKGKSFHQYVYIESRYKVPSRGIIGKIKVKFDISLGKMAELQPEERQQLLKNRRLIDELRHSRRYKVHKRMNEVKEQAHRGSNNFREQKQGTEEYYKQYITSLHQENQVLTFRNIQLKRKYEKLMLESGSSIALQHSMLLRSFEAQRTVLVHQDQASRMVANELERSIMEKDGLIKRQKGRIEELERLCRDSERRLLELSE